MVTTILSAENVTKVYQTSAERVEALRGATLHVDSGELVCLLGSSGSGKTTLINAMAGLEGADSGSITVCGQPISLLSEDDRTALRLECIGVVFQENNLINEFSASANVMLPLRARGWSVRAAASAADEALERVGIRGLRDRMPLSLSGGQKQRVGIARALVGGRQVLLADEPSGALDSRTSDALFSLIRSLCDEGLAAVVATHDPVAVPYADRVLEMIDGAIVTGRVSVP